MACRIVVTTGGIVPRLLDYWQVDRRLAALLPKSALLGQRPRSKRRRSHLRQGSTPCRCVLIFRSAHSSARTKKKSLQIRLVGIKNSWKYEKDFLLLNVIYTFITISQ